MVQLSTTERSATKIKAYTSDSYECPMLNEDHFVAFSFEIIEI